MRTLIASLRTKSILLLLVFSSYGCQKKLNESGSSCVDAARNFFESTVAVAGEAPTTFGRGEGEGHPVWSAAVSTPVPTGEAVWVPIQYQRSYYIGTNFSGDWLLDINRLQFLVLYTTDGFASATAKLMTYYPDSTCIGAAAFVG